MDFNFVHSTKARAVVSCKSTLTSIDKDHPKNLKKFGIKHVYLLAETCKQSRFETLKKQAKAAGYRGVWCLYFETDLGHLNDEGMLRDFSNTLHADALKLEGKSSATSKKTPIKVSVKKVSRDSASFPKKSTPKR